MSITYRSIKGTTQEGSICNRWILYVDKPMEVCKMPALYLGSEGIVKDLPVCRQCLERLIELQSKFKTSFSGILFRSE